jgi:hypothetical protein
MWGECSPNTDITISPLPNSFPFNRGKLVRMKGLSIILSFALLLLASHLANRLRESGKLPARDGQYEVPAANFAKNPAPQRPIRL